MDKRKIAYNTAIQVIGKIITTLLGLATIGLLLRYLGQAGYGEYITILAFVGVFSTLTDLGLYIIHVREISKVKDHSHITSNIITLRLTAGLFILGLAPLAGLFMPYTTTVKTGILIAVLSFLFVSLNQILVGIFQKNLNLSRVVIADFIGRLLWLLGVYIATKQNLSLPFLMVILSLTSLSTFLFNFLSAKKYTKISLQFDFRYWRKILGWSWPIALSIVFNLVYFKIGTILLSVMKPAEHVGLYGAGFKILEILITVPASFIGLLMPFLSLYAVRKNKHKFKQILDQGFTALAILALPIVVGAYFTAVPLLTFLGKEDFSKSGEVLQIISLAVAFIFLGQIFSNSVVALNKQKQMLWGYLAVAVLAVLLNLALIPKFSYIGASWATVITELVIMLWAMVLVSKATGKFVSLKKIPKIILSTAVMGLILYLFSSLNVLALMILGGVIYLVALLLFGVIDKKTIKALLPKL